MTSATAPILSGQTLSHHLLLEHAMGSRRHAAMVEADGGRRDRPAPHLLADLRRAHVPYIPHVAMTISAN